MCLVCVSVVPLWWRAAHHNTPQWGRLFHSGARSLHDDDDDDGDDGDGGDGGDGGDDGDDGGQNSIVICLVID